MINNRKTISQANSSFLDMSRGISAQMVLVGHLISMYGLYELYIPKFQNLGVMIFFIMSGFLITYVSIIKGVKYGLKNFMIDRFSRIYSGLFPAFILIFIVDLYIKSNHSTVAEYVFNYSFINFIYNLFLLHNHPLFLNLLHSTSFGSARILWTVSIEWLFYIFFGIIFYWKIIFKNSPIIKYLLLIFFFIPPFFYLAGRGEGLSIYWFLGSVLAFVHFQNFKINRPKILFLIILILILAFGYRTVFMELFEMYDVGLSVILFFLFSCIFLINETTHFIKVFFIKTILFNKFLASYSYSLYLIHYSLIILLLDFCKGFSVYQAIILNFVAINIFSFVFYKLFENKYIFLRNSIKGFVN